MNSRKSFVDWLPVLLDATLPFLRVCRSQVGAVDGDPSRHAAWHHYGSHHTEARWELFIARGRVAKIRPRPVGVV